MTNKTLKKIGRWAAIGLTSLVALNYGAKEIALNVMSHTGYNQSMSVFTTPKTYLTRGEYRGFKDKVDPENRLPKPLHDLDLNAVYLGLQKNPLPLSEHKPTRLSNSENITFYSLKDFICNQGQLVGRVAGLSESGLKRILDMKEGDAISYLEATTSAKSCSAVAPSAGVFTDVDLGNYTLSFGRDKNGIYTSIYDVWDFTPDAGYFKENKNSCWPAKVGSKILPKIGEPIHFYDRIYWKDYTNSSTMKLIDGVTK